MADYFTPRRKTRSYNMSVSTTPDLGAALKTLAHNNGTSVNELVNKILADAIQNEQGGK